VKPKAPPGEPMTLGNMRELVMQTASISEAEEAFALATVMRSRRGKAHEYPITAPTSDVRDV
jgi:hypothetical protein